MAAELTISHSVMRDDMVLGVVLVDGIVVAPSPQELELALNSAIARRASSLSAEEDAIRKGARDILRNGKYKPTGRGKPASEYLLRAAGLGDFPRINGPVDANNLMSLETLMPISVWDVDLAGGQSCDFRLGEIGASYVFNHTGQSLELSDLVCGYTKNGSEWIPHVTPIKDSMRTKLVADTKTVAGCIYFTTAFGSEEQMLRETNMFMNWLLKCGENTNGSAAIVRPRETVRLAA